MGVLEALGLRKKASASALQRSKPKEIIFQFLPGGTVVWYDADGKSFLDNGYLGNHVIFTIVDWIAQKVASAPPILYEVKDEREYKRYKLLKKDSNVDSLRRARAVRTKALAEVDGGEMMKLFTTPNEIMTWHEYAYGHVVFKNMVGSSYWSASRDGVSDKTTGKIRELWLLPSQNVHIISGGVNQPIEGYALNTAPDKKIDKANVCQFRNFSPRYDTPTQWLYGLPKLYAAKDLLQSYNEGVQAEVEMYQKRGIRDIIFPKAGDYPPSIEQIQETQDTINRKMFASAKTGVIANSHELGSIRVGLSPTELGILESNKISKKDFCALFHVSDIIFNWSDQTTYNNMAEARKTSFVDAVIPELEAIKDGLNNWLVPSWYPNKNYVLDFDIEYFPEMQEDISKAVEWMEKADCLEINEKRAVLHYDASTEKNANKIIVSSSKVLLEDMGIESFGTDLESENMFEDEPEATR